MARSGFPLPPPHVRGALWMVVACVAFAGLWVMIRLASQELHPFAVVVWRTGNVLATIAVGMAALYLFKVLL